MRVESVGRSSVSVAHEIIRADGQIAAEGRSVLVAWDRDERRSRPLSDSERAALT
jgi:acyl-CoA thioesterase FadM